MSAGDIGVIDVALLSVWAAMTPSGKAIAIDSVTDTSTRAMVCSDAIHNLINQQKPNAQMARMATRQVVSTHASAATTAIVPSAGSWVRTASTAANVASPVALIAPKKW